MTDEAAYTVVSLNWVLTADAKHRQSYNRYTRRGLVGKVGVQLARARLMYCSIQTRNALLAEYRYKKDSLLIMI